MDNFVTKEWPIAQRLNKKVSRRDRERKVHVTHGACEPNIWTIPYFSTPIPRQHLLIFTTESDARHVPWLVRVPKWKSPSSSSLRHVYSHLPATRWWPSNCVARVGLLLGGIFNLGDQTRTPRIPSRACRVSSCTLDEPFFELKASVMSTQA